MSSGVLTNKSLSLDSLTVRGVPITGGSSSIQSGFVLANTISWVSITGGYYQGIITGVSGVSPTSKITVATQLANTDTLDTTLPAMAQAWIVGAYPSSNAGGEIFVYLASYPNSTGTPGTPDAGYGLSWCVNSL